MAIVQAVGERVAWSRPLLATAGGLVVLAVVVAAFRLPAGDLTVWLEALTVAAVLTAGGVRVFRAGLWSGVGSGLGARLGGVALLALLRPFVESDPLMQAEWQQRNSSVDLATYVTRETTAGVGGHLWVLGIAQGALLGVLAALVTTAAIRVGTATSRSTAASDAG